MRKFLFSLSVFVVLTIGCLSEASSTPTPFPTEVYVPPLPPTGEAAVPLSLADLAENPEGSENVRVRVTGRYRPLPQLVCAEAPNPSPADWELVSNDGVIQVNGFAGELRSLASENLTVTVDGHWLKWRGPVGCGKQAVMTEVWYLDASRIVDPSPMIAVTLTPTMTFGIEVNTTTTGTITTEVPFEPTAVFTSGIPTSPPILPPTEVPVVSEEVTPTIPAQTDSTMTPTLLPTTAPEQATATPNSDEDVKEEETSTPSATTEGGNTPTATPTLGANNGLTATATVSSFTPTATPTNDPFEPTATPTATSESSGNVVEQGKFEEDSLVAATLEDGEIHSWSFTLGSSEVITVTALAVENVDLVLAIVDANDSVVHLQNDTAAGQPETVGSLALNPGTFQVYVSSANQVGSDYALLMQFDESAESFMFASSIGYGASENSALPEFSSQFWVFAGLDGDAISITAVPSNVSDVFIELYGPDGALISQAFYNTGETGVAEQLDIQLRDDGIYVIRVGEWNFEAGNYELSLVKNN